MTCEEIWLVKPTLELEKEALKYRQEHFDFGEQVINGSELFDKISSYSEWLEKVIANASLKTVDPNWVLTDVTAAESKATYNEIRDYVLEHHQLKVSNLYIAQVKHGNGAGNETVSH